jgi:pimeloyl-ACP methyl ester carboxylesterase
MPPEIVAATDPISLAPIFGHDLADQPPIVMKQLSAMRKYECVSRLGELKDLPTLVVAAEHDMIARPEYGRAMAAAISGSSYIEIPGAAHGVTIQCADRINKILLAHLTAAENMGNFNNET